MRILMRLLDAIEGVLLVVLTKIDAPIDATAEHFAAPFRAMQGEPPANYKPHGAPSPSPYGPAIQTIRQNWRGEQP
jgi:hypothetical protein